MPTRKIGDWSSTTQYCRHFEHNPPAHKVMEPGLYEHECPGCGHKQNFRVQARPVHTERYYRFGWSVTTEYEATVYAESPEEAEEKLGTWLSVATPEMLARQVRREEGSEGYYDCGAVDTREQALQEMCNEEEVIIGE